MTRSPGCDAGESGGISLPKGITHAFPVFAVNSYGLDLFSRLPFFGSDCSSSNQGPSSKGATLLQRGGVYPLRNIPALVLVDYIKFSTLDSTFDSIISMLMIL